MSSPCKLPHGHSHQHSHHHHHHHGGPEEDPAAAVQNTAEDYSNWDIVKATQHGMLERCRELVDAGYDVRQPDKENVTLLHWAAINNRLELVKYFISKGAIVDQLGGTLNSTPLHWAVRQGHLQMVIMLMRCGADPTLIDGEGYSSLHLAVLFQHLPIIAYLVSKGQSVDSPDMNGMTPLMLSAHRIIGLEPTNFLLKLNPSIHATDKVERNTALHWAVVSGNVNALDLLLESGCNLDAVNAKGETPLEIARQTRNRLTVHILAGEAQMRSRRSSRIMKALQQYEISLVSLMVLLIIWAVGYVLDMNTDSWLLKGTLLALLTAASQLFARHFIGYKSQKSLPAIFFSCSIFWMFLTWFIYFLPSLARMMFQLPFIISMLFLFYFFYKTWSTDPGYIKSSEEESRQTIITLAEAGCLDGRLFCTSCLVKKPVRSMHCQTCNSCVARFDQHCMWTGQCIGAGNQHYFVLFLGSLSLVGNWMIYATAVYWSDHCGVGSKKDGMWMMLSHMIDCSPWVLYMFCLVCTFTIWASLMLLVQLYQITFLGLTTQERISLQVQNRHLKHQVSLRRTPFNRGCRQNLSDFFHCQCFGLIKSQQAIDWTKQFHGGIPPARMRHPQTV
ncbi:palmitoyltransferase ZDHHC13 [Xenopus laevis]|uniref:Palmitoyltransferase n=2 Tax=Xenopus laevis TaxID=8355 RepID=A0A1L8GID3_XENLA|nr:palmitoyltransferase ZDHHC13 [Xenopus laevis]OCT83598.1 hypothetical protein XELAEV_18021740mg [Xenopus laevis]